MPRPDTLFSELLIQKSVWISFDLCNTPPSRFPPPPRRIAFLMRMPLSVAPLRCRCLLTQSTFITQPRRIEAPPSRASKPWQPFPCHHYLSTVPSFRSSPPLLPKFPFPSIPSPESQRARISPLFMTLPSLRKSRPDKVPGTCHRFVHLALNAPPSRPFSAPLVSQRKLLFLVVFRRRFLGLWKKLLFFFFFCNLIGLWASIPCSPPRRGSSDVLGASGTRRRPFPPAAENFFSLCDPLPSSTVPQSSSLWWFPSPFPAPL